MIISRYEQTCSINVASWIFDKLGKEVGWVWEEGELLAIGSHDNTPAVRPGKYLG